jgi:hypothetical protein
MPAMLALVLLLQTAEPLTHLHQMGLSMNAGSGFRFIVPYEDGLPCGEAGKRVCISHVRAFLELGLSYGVATSLDVIADFRFGLESDFTTTTDFHFAPGVKYFMDPEGPLKFYATGQLVFDNEDQMTTRVSSFDFGLRNADGVQYEIGRYFGVFAQFGDTLGFVRWLRIELDFAGGVQGRFP